MAKIWVKESQKYFEVYDSSWNLFRADDGKWYRCKPDDIRSARQLCVQGVTIDENYLPADIDQIPIAKPLTDKELEEIKQYNETHFLPWGHRNMPRFQSRSWPTSGL